MKPSSSAGAILLAAAVVFLAGQEVRAWGGLFNRFNPSMLSNLGYGGGGYGKQLFGVSQKNEIPSLVSDGLDEQSDAGDSDPCMEKRCTANEHCCSGHVCVDADEENDEPGYGVCLPVFGKKSGEFCYRDNDCESGFVCAEDDNGDKTCQAPSPGTQALGEECRTSSDCHIEKGLCCKLQRRGRGQPKKICGYFSDPLTCIGHVATHRVKNRVEHTAGEKRISGHPDYHHLK